jgi:hypothetical protein
MKKQRRMERKYNLANHLFNFIAVILGVYLAFYMNEKAKEKQDRTESVVLMRSLINDLASDIKIYEAYQIPVNVEYQENLGILLNSLVVDSLESLDEQLAAILGVDNYAPTTSTYSSMKSSGKLSLIDDLALQKALSDYYEGVVEESVRKGEFQVDYFTNELLTWLTEEVDLMDVKISDRDKLVVLRNKLLIYESFLTQKVTAYEGIVEDSKKLKSQIESVLEAR